jgi:biotin carboxylase
MGYCVIGVFTQSKESYEQLFRAEHEKAFIDCDEVILSDQAEVVLKKLKTLPYAIQGVMAGSEAGVEMADEIAHALGKWGNRYELSKARRHKGEMRRAIKESGLACPDFAICQTEKEVANFANSHRFPLIIKTPKGAMTSQVHECEDLKSLIQFFHEIYKQKDIYGTQADCAVVEEYIGGKEYIIDTFSDGKKVHVTDMWVYDFINAPHFKNIYYNAISLPLDDPKMKSLMEYGIKTAQVVGIERGPAHIEIKDDPIKGPMLIEVGARLIGSQISEFLRKYSNFNPYTASIEVFTRGRVAVPSPIVSSRHCAVALCPLLKGGKVKEIHGVSEIERLSSYESHWLKVKKGEVVEPSTHGGSIPIVVYLSHSNRAQLLKDVDLVHKLFSIELEPSHLRHCG